MDASDMILQNSQQIRSVCACFTFETIKSTIRYISGFKIMWASIMRLHIFNNLESISAWGLPKLAFGNIFMCDSLDLIENSVHCDLHFPCFLNVNFHSSTFKTKFISAVSSIQIMTTGETTLLCTRHSNSDETANRRRRSIIFMDS